MNSEWHTTLKCTVAETLSHRIVLVFKFKSMARTVKKGKSAKTGQFVSIEYAQKHNCSRKRSKLAQQNAESNFKTLECA